jgi:HEAT repeat protein
MARATRAEQISAGFRRKMRKARGREERLDHEEIAELLRWTEAEDAEIRNEAVQNLCPCHVQANIAPVWDRLIAMVDDPDARVRSTILHTLCDGSPRERETEIVQAIERMYNDPDPKLRRRVRWLLATYRRTGKVNVL